MITPEGTLSLPIFSWGGEGGNKGSKGFSFPFPCPLLRRLWFCLFGYVQDYSEKCLRYRWISIKLFAKMEPGFCMDP